MITIISVVLAVISSFLGATGMLFFKLGSKKASLRVMDWLTNWKVMLGILLYFTALLALIISMKSGDLSIVYPIYALSYIWVALFSKRFLNEKISLINWLGFAIIMVGVSLTVIK